MSSPTISYPDANGNPCSWRRWPGAFIDKPHIYFSAIKSGKGCWAYNLPLNMKSSAGQSRRAWEYLQMLNKKMRYSNHPVF